MARTTKIAIIGAGMAGITAARELHDAGHRVTVFEKSRGRGGRMATRRGESLQADHGAQYFTVREPEFSRALDRFGAKQPWHPRIVDASGAPVERDETMWVGSPGMSSVVAAMSEGLRIMTTTRVETIEDTARGFRLVDDAGHILGSYDWVVSTAPSEQTAKLIEGPAPGAAGHIRESVEMAPAWAACFVFPESLNARFDVRVEDEGPIRWLARNSSKPGRGEHETWVAHASPSWSHANLGLTTDEAGRFLLDLVAPALPSFRKPTRVVAHRWRYAQVVRPLGEAFLVAEESPRILAAGDWCVYGRVEAAFCSGLSAARHILKA